MVPTAIMAAAVLHNLCIEMRLPEPEEEVEDLVDDDMEFEFSEVAQNPEWRSDLQAHRLGALRRDELATRFN